MQVTYLLVHRKLSSKKNGILTSSRRLYFHKPNLMVNWFCRQASAGNQDICESVSLMASVVVTARHFSQSLIRPWIKALRWRQAGLAKRVCHFLGKRKRVGEVRAPWLTWNNPVISSVAATNHRVGGKFGLESERLISKRCNSKLSEKEKLSKAFNLLNFQDYNAAYNVLFEFKKGLKKSTVVHPNRLTFKQNTRKQQRG